MYYHLHIMKSKQTRVKKVSFQVKKKRAEAVCTTSAKEEDSGKTCRGGRSPAASSGNETTGYYCFFLALSMAKTLCKTIKKQSKAERTILFHQEERVPSKRI